VELKEGETTIVLWKKLVASAKRKLELKMPSKALIALDPATHVSNQSTFVIEKIEYLFKGGDNRDDNGGDSRDDNAHDSVSENWYDEELDKYFVKRKMRTKHLFLFLSTNEHFRRLVSLFQLQLYTPQKEVCRIQEKQGKCTFAT